MEDVAVYGYITPLKVKIVLALALSDTVVRDVEITTVCFILYAFSFGDIHPWFSGFQGTTHGILFLNLESVLEIRRTKCPKRSISIPSRRGSEMEELPTTRRRNQQGSWNCTTCVRYIGKLFGRSNADILPVHVMVGDHRLQPHSRATTRHSDCQGE
jgi:hypothetical protein